MLFPFVVSVFLSLFLFCSPLFVSSLDCTSRATEFSIASVGAGSASPRLLVDCPFNCPFDRDVFPTGSFTSTSGQYSLKSSICGAAARENSRVSKFIRTAPFNDGAPAFFTVSFEVHQSTYFTLSRLPRYIYRYGQYSECSNYCGGGIQTRSVECIDYHTGAPAPSWGYCPTPEPITVRHCNIRPCSATVKCQSRFTDIDAYIRDHEQNHASGKLNNSTDRYFDDSGRLRVQCPSDCIPNTYRSATTLSVFGSNPYTDLSLVCLSGFHATSSDAPINSDMGDSYFFVTRQSSSGPLSGSVSNENFVPSQDGSSTNGFIYQITSAALRDNPVPPYYSYSLTHRQFSSCSFRCGGGVQISASKCIRYDNAEPNNYQVVDESFCHGQEHLKFTLNQTCSPQACPIACNLESTDLMFRDRDSVLVQCEGGCDLSSEPNSICARAVRSKIISPVNGGLVQVYPGIGISYPPCNSPAWESIGPHHVQLPGAYTGGMENIVDPSVIGAISAIVFVPSVGSAHNSASDVALVASPNGGIWRTNNIHLPTPDFEPMTDSQLVNSIGHIAVDRADPTWIVASIGGFSSLNYFSGEWRGLLISHDAGLTWSITHNFPFGYSIAQATTCSRRSGSTEPFARPSDADARIIVATAAHKRGQRYSGSSGGSWFKSRFGGGIFRSTDGGQRWEVASSYRTFKVDSHPLNCSIMFAPAISPFNNNASVVLRSMDAGATWEERTFDVSSIPASDTNAPLALFAPTNAVVSIHATASTGASVFVGFFNSDAKQSDAYVFFLSRDLGDTWIYLDTPVTSGSGGEGKFGLGGQGDIHFSGLADPVDPFVFYTGGTAQQAGNDIGATSSSSRLFRLTYSESSDPKYTWAPLVLSDTISGTSVHADSRCFAYDHATGNLFNGNDGGIYFRPNPRTPKGGDWRPLNGDLQVSEIHSIAWDWRAAFSAAGAQDNSIFYTLDQGSKNWVQTGSGDGGKVLVDPLRTDANGDAFWYNTAQNLANFARTSTYAVAANSEYWRWPGNTPTSQARYFHFQEMYTPNAIDSNKMMVCSNPVFVRNKTSDSSCWEMDFGIPGLVTRLTGFNTYDCYRYGGYRSNDADFNVILAISNFTVLSENVQRSNIYSVDIINRFPLPSSPNVPLWGQCKQLALDASDYYNAFFVDDRSHVFQTRNFGQSWRNITGDLFTVTQSIEQPFAWTLAVVPFIDSKRSNMKTNAVVVGTARGVYVAFEGDYMDEQHWGPTFAGFKWQYLGEGLPNVLIFDIQYSAMEDQLLIAAFGRGGWRIQGISSVLSSMRLKQSCVFRTHAPVFAGGKFYVQEIATPSSTGSSQPAIASSSAHVAAQTSTGSHPTLGTSSTGSPSSGGGVTGSASTNMQESHLIRNSLAITLAIIIVFAFVFILVRTIRSRRSFLSATERIASRQMEMQSRPAQTTAKAQSQSPSTASSQASSQV